MLEAFERRYTSRVTVLSSRSRLTTLYLDGTLLAVKRLAGGAVDARTGEAENGRRDVVDAFTALALTCRVSTSECDKKMRLVIVSPL